MKENIAQDDMALIRQARAGDSEAFSQLMENHAVLAYRIAFAILQHQGDAEDVVQEAFITAFKSIKNLEKETAFRSWLSRIVTTRAYDLLRQKQRGQKAIDSETVALKMEIHQSSTSPAEDKQAMTLDLQEAMTRLPETHRLVILLRYSQDATADEIAGILNRPAGTIRRVLSESYRMLRLYLEGDDSP